MSADPKKFYFNRRMVLAGLFSSAASVVLAKAPKRSVRPEPRPQAIKLLAAGSVEDIVKSAKLDGKVGFMVADAATGEILESYKPLLGLPPASVTKAITTIYSLDALGSAHKFNTQLVATGPIENGRLSGDLYLVGGGDPTLDTDALGELARDLKDAGVREITGKAYVHSGALPYQKSIDPGQPEHLGYNPSLSGLNLNYNRVFFEWKRLAEGYSITMDARALKFRPRVAMSSIKVVDRSSPIFSIKSTSTTDQWTVSKRALGKKGGRWLPVRRPEFYAAEVFHTIARSFGIQLPAFTAAKSRPTGTVIAQWQSAKLGVMLRRMMKHSTNLTAEAVGVTASRKRGGSPAKLKDSGRMMAAWLKTRTGAKHAKFVDHSGLGDGSRISASDMTKVLVKQGWGGPLRQLMKDIPLRDTNGKPVKNHPVKVRAKTGTLNFVSALAGYIEAPKGRRLVFAVFSADLPRRVKITKANKERPKGARGWNRRSKIMQQQLIERWVTAFDG
ncbi:MAG: D-alanyl-D-alanine carboxypeptidase/D-alanyl-D-alanine-endopeptidase (penicillin-binding protein 4) [Paracoccaceae bacterium]|jgi:D-alanyl-D-alanine carboxypeptidase/D-alanyl-D-alanine-endopeptidase (penicillin-binding protein 4)